MIFTENLVIELIHELKAQGAILADITPVIMTVDSLEKYQKKDTVITNYKASVLLKDDNNVQFRHTVMLFPNGGTQKMWNMFEAHFHSLPFTQINQPVQFAPVVIGECVMLNIMHKMFDANKQNNFASRRNVVLKGEWYSGAIQMIADAKFQTNNNAPAPTSGYKAPVVTGQTTTAQATAQTAQYTPPATPDLPY